MSGRPAISRKSYVHPAIVDSFMEGTLKRRLHARVRVPRLGPALRRLRPSEAGLLRLLAGVQKQK